MNGKFESELQHATWSSRSVAGKARAGGSIGSFTEKPQGTYLKLTSLGHDVYSCARNSHVLGKLVDVKGTEQAFGNFQHIAVFVV